MTESNNVTGSGWEREGEREGERQREKESEREA